MDKNESALNLAVPETHAMEELSQLVVIGFMLFIPAIAVAGLLWMMREKLSARREMSAKKSMPRPK